MGQNRSAMRGSSIDSGHILKTGSMKKHPMRKIGSLGTFGGIKDRFFVLNRSGQLLYFGSEEDFRHDASALGAFQISKSTVLVVIDNLCIKLSGDGKNILRLECHSIKDCNEWVDRMKSLILKFNSSNGSPQKSIIRVSRLTNQHNTFAKSGMFKLYNESMGFHPEQLPPDILELRRQNFASGNNTNPLTLKYLDIMVDRRAENSPEGFMTTKDVVMEVGKKVHYHIEKTQCDGRSISNVTLVQSNPAAKSFCAVQDIRFRTSGLTALSSVSKSTKGGLTFAKSSSGTKYLELGYKWNTGEVFDDFAGNIFGDNSLLQVFADELIIPVNIPTIAHFEDFNAVLLDVGESFTFEIPEERDTLPLTLMSVGKDYIDDFIMGGHNPNASGAYLEYHDNPHFHCPCNADAGGVLVLGKIFQEEEVLHLAAFPIPFGKAVYMKPYTVHNDCFLTGDYLVVYAGTDNFATGTVVTTKQEKCYFKFSTD